MPETSRRSHLAAEPGQTLTEYAILVGGVVLVLVAVLPLVGSSIGSLFSAFAAAFGG
jgi:Flp pilus assembly pilin Flp